MENRCDSDVVAELAELKDLEMAGFVKAAEDPLWLWPLIGLVAGAFLASFELKSVVVGVVASVAYVIGVGIIVGSVIRRRGVQPRLSGLPGSLKQLTVSYGIGVFVFTPMVTGIGFGVSFVLAGVIAFALVTVGGIWFHLRWRDAVASLVTA